MSLTRFIAGLACVACWSCTFPDVTFEAAGGAGGSGAGSSTSTNSPSTGTSGSTSSSPGCQGPWDVSCNADGDTAPKNSPECCDDPMMVDCDDADPEVFPGQLDWFDVPRMNGGTFDYNCSSADEPEFTFAQCGAVDCVQTPNAQHYGLAGPTPPCAQTVPSTYCDTNDVCQQNTTLVLRCH